ncbi:MAG TPA: hypothetical protein VGV89_06355 [Thermoplasmata archaeon]|nr:hypothetical protein [Thermoplasmata archaeon]
MAAVSRSTAATHAPRHSGSPSTLPWNVAAAVAGVTILLLLSSAGVASTPSTVVLKAPYRGTRAIVSDTANPLIPSRCSSATVQTRSAWNASSGAAQGAGSATVRSSKSCTNPTGSMSTGAVYEDDFQIGVPIPTPRHSGVHSVAANWSVSANLSWSIVHGPCPKAVLVNGTGSQACGISAAGQVYVTAAYLLDLTGQSLWVSSHASPLAFQSYWNRSVSCYRYSCSTGRGQLGNTTGSLAARTSWNFSWSGVTLNASHRYALEFYFGTYVGVTVAASPQPWFATATASIAAASPGLGFTLRSVTVA